MTAILILVVLLAIALAAPHFGADTRSDRGWMPTGADRRPWGNTYLPGSR